MGISDGLMEIEGFKGISWALRSVVRYPGGVTRDFRGAAYFRGIPRCLHGFKRGSRAFSGDF